MGECKASYRWVVLPLSYCDASVFRGLQIWHRPCSIVARGVNMETQSGGVTSRTGPTGFSILVVDDEVTTRDVCSDIALEAGLADHSLASPEHALDVLD